MPSASELKQKNHVSMHSAIILSEMLFIMLVFGVLPLVKLMGLHNEFVYGEGLHCMNSGFTQKFGNDQFKFSMTKKC